MIMMLTLTSEIEVRKKKKRMANNRKWNEFYILIVQNLNFRLWRRHSLIKFIDKNYKMNCRIYNERISGKKRSAVYACERDVASNILKLD